MLTLLRLEIVGNGSMKNVEFEKSSDERRKEGDKSETKGPIKE